MKVSSTRADREGLGGASVQGMVPPERRDVGERIGWADGTLNPEELSIVPARRYRERAATTEATEDATP